MGMGLPRRMKTALQQKQVMQRGRYKAISLLVSCLLISACAYLGGNSVRPIETPATVKQDRLAGNVAQSANAQPQMATTEGTRNLAGFDEECNKRIRQTRKFFMDTESGDKATHVKVAATGYGAPPKNYFPEGQRRLMTMRASKIDAYRALAEVVGGIHVWGGTAISNMVLEKDRYRVFIDTYVRGARTVSVDKMKDNTYQTVVEMHVDQLFLSQVMAFVDPVLAQCLRNNESTNMTINAAAGVTPTFYYSE